MKKNTEKRVIHDLIIRMLETQSKCLLLTKKLSNIDKYRLNIKWLIGVILDKKYKRKKNLNEEHQPRTTR